MNSVFGRYLPINTPLHFIDARLKILLTAVSIAMVFLSNYLVSSLLFLFFVMAVYYMTTKRWKSFFRILITPVLVSLFVFLLNMFTAQPITDPNNAGIPYNGFPNWVKEGGGDSGNFRVTITYNMVMEFAALVIRIYTIILITSLLTLTTKQIFLAKAIEFWIYPLKFLFIPVEIISMIISIALRFIPTLLEEARRIMKAQASRGVDFKNGKLREKAKSTIVLIIPLFVTSFNKAEDLAFAMETRGYDPYKARSKYRRLSFKWYDYLTFLFFMAFLAYFIVFKIEPIATQVSVSNSGFWHNYISFDYSLSGFVAR
ncbi:hypothetical protein CJJ23_04390 [Mycoplasmopsis agassizii]|uniref:Energy-coupling factor transporter transmembrane protein EcfT n=1 Tax=Mycoplasmopsis agassizii TaxID=33922 RepID=A0A269THU0_9BACT|nr:energy-coupling factor transporter transmembrane protein EcfT [Mycoplasmopsis agassizii]PAK20951.1 hypothetical protein CJJ23_04390 [Mycoplasmopsis agassizii]